MPVFRDSSASVVPRCLRRSRSFGPTAASTSLSSSTGASLPERHEELLPDGRLSHSRPPERSSRTKGSTRMKHTGAGEAERFWEGHYSGRQQVWRGDPNPLLVETAAALTPGSALDLGCGE